MPFINIGTGNDLILELPTKRTQNWNDRYVSNFATVIAQHDHTGSGSGRLITTSALAAGSIDETKINLNNDSYLTSRNVADTANIDILKIDTNDQLYFGSDISNIASINNDYYLGRNNADSAYINVFKVNASDLIEFGVSTVHNGKISLSEGTLQSTKTFTIANTQTNADVTGLTLTEDAGKAYKLVYSIYIDATTDLIESGSIIFSFDGTNWDQDRSYSHDDSLVTFDVNSTQVRYSSSTYTGYADGTLTYLLIEL